MQMEYGMNLGMLRLFRLLVLAFLITNTHANVKNLDFDIIKKGKEDKNTLLIVGGIQGDEPGGFMAASLIVTHYNIKKGSVWVVPNLNFYSIIKRSRGPYGDMNRKFSMLSNNDPDYESIQKIKNYIKSDQVKLVLNLHDGSGYYRKQYIDKKHSPYKWGQSSIIDQSSVDIEPYGNLNAISQEVCKHINQYLIRKEDSYLVHNTKTKDGDKEMEKTLTYFAINNGKAAFGNEASKELPVHERAYYHLLALEKYMNIMGIEFERKFKMTPMNVKKAIDKDIYISFYNDKIKIPLNEIRNRINYFPMKKDGTLDFKPSTPVMTVIKNKQSYAIHYGNRRLAILSPDYLEIPDSNEHVTLNVDGEIKELKFGSVIKVQNKFLVQDKKDLRVNVIGYTNKKRKNESNVYIKKYEIAKRFSLDKKGNIYRVEFYKNNKFIGMILVDFNKNSNLNETFALLEK